MDLIWTIEDGRIGGRPGPTREPWDLAALKRDGWTVIVSFECDGLDPAEILRAGIEHKMICVEDFAAPTIDQLQEFNEFIERKLAEGKKVLAHCYAGRGRTGTFLASRLVSNGVSVEDAVAHVRKRIVDSQGTLAGAIESVQLEALHHFAEVMRRRIGVMVVRFDEAALRVALERVSPELRVAFAAACAERLMPAYVAFSNRSTEGDSEALGSILARLWEDLLGNPMSEVELGRMIAASMGLVRRANSGPFIPERAAAEDAAVAVAYALRSRQNGQAEEAAWSARHAYEAIDECVTSRGDFGMNDPEAEMQVLSDPLIQAELLRQHRDLDDLTRLEHSDVRRVATRLRDRARIDGPLVFGPVPKGGLLRSKGPGP